MSVFVDWITISQRHPEANLPIVSDGYIVASNADMTELHWESLQHHKCEGSFDTALRIRCDGQTVFVSGNVGRFCRPDNVFNLDFEKTITKTNELLVTRYGLPPFSAGERVVNLHPSEYDTRKGLIEHWTGATVSNLHLTSNLETGSESNAQRVIDWVDTQSVSHVKKSRGGATSCAFGGKKSRKLLKFYIKHSEMFAHCKKAVERLALADNPVYQYTKSTGIVRCELELHRLMLRDHELRYLGDISMPKLVRLFRTETEILNRVRVESEKIEITSLPMKVRQTAALYLKGENLFDFMKKTAWYNHAKILRQYGIDIAAPHNVSAFPVSIRVIEIKEAAAPDWYWKYSQEQAA